MCDLRIQSNPDNFHIEQKYLCNHEAKINEALVIKNENPPLNKNLFNKGSLFTSNIYY